MVMPAASDLLVARVRLERARRRELAELVADHVLGDQHRDVLPAVVDGDREADHVRQDHRAARPGLDRLAIVLGGGRLAPSSAGADRRTDLSSVNEACADPLNEYGSATLHDHAGRALVVARLVALGRSSPTGDTGCGLPWPDLPSPPPCGWSTGFMATPRTVGRMPRQRFAPALP